MLLSPKNINFLMYQDLEKIRTDLLGFLEIEFSYEKKGKPLDDLFSDLFDTFDFEDGSVDKVYDVQVLRFVDLNLLQSLKNAPQDEKLLEAVYDHLEIIAAATNNIPGLELYSVREITGILLAEAEYDKIRFFHTLRQSIGEEDTREYGFVYLEYLQSEQKLNLPLRESSLVQSLILDNLWKNFATLPIDAKNYLLSSAYSISFFLSVPIRKSIQDFLYSTTTPVDLSLDSNLICQGVLKNTESFFVDSKQTQEKEFVLCIRELTFQVGTQNYEPALAESYVQKTFPSLDQTYSESLILALDTFFQVKNGSLIEHNLGDEESDVDSMNKDMSQLVQWFSNRADWDKIVQYFQKEKTLVPKDFFLTQLKDTFDFSQDSDLQTLSDFSALLLDGGVISEELFIFDESDTQFHWNENVFTS